VSTNDKLWEMAKAIEAGPPKMDGFVLNDKRCWTTHVPVVGKSRDAENYEIINWDVFVEQLEVDDNDDAFVAYFRHWAVGWIDELFVKLYNDDGTYTDSAIQAAELMDAKESEVCLDDERLYEMNVKDIAELERIPLWLADRVFSEMEVSSLGDFDYKDLEVSLEYVIGELLANHRRAIENCKGQMNVYGEEAQVPEPLTDYVLDELSDVVERFELQPDGADLLRL